MTNDRPSHGSRLGVHHRAVGGDAAGVFMRELGAMKKAKVNRLIAKFKDEACQAGREQGKREERARYEETIFAPSRDGMIWLGNQPPTRDYYTICMPQGYHSLQYDPSDRLPYMFERNNTRVDFKLKQKGIAFANGVSIRWADWEPMGPYPVIDFADPPRRRW